MATLFYKAQTRFLFHAHIKIKLSAFYDDQLFDKLFAILENADRLYNSYQPHSYITLINNNAGQFVEVDDETINILRRVIDLSDHFDGEYDITIMPLLRLWGFYRSENKTLPSRQDIEAVLPLVNYKHIEIEGNRVRIAHGQEIITGSFIKAYAIDKLVAEMCRMGIDDAIVNAGGSTIYAINNEAHPSWEVNVRHPLTDELLFTQPLANNCYSTSSLSKTFVEIDGRQYGHILNPRTGMPSHNKRVGIVSDSCMLGDILSTGLFNLTKDDFDKKIEAFNRLYGVRGFLL